MGFKGFMKQEEDDQEEMNKKKMNYSWVYETVAACGFMKILRGFMNVKRRVFVKEKRLYAAGKRKSKYLEDYLLQFSRNRSI